MAMEQQFVITDLLLAPNIQVHIPGTSLTRTNSFLLRSWVQFQAICLSDKSDIGHQVCSRALY